MAWFNDYDTYRNSYGPDCDYDGPDSPTGERHWLAESDYDYCPENEIWTKEVHWKGKARKAHKGTQWVRTGTGLYDCHREDAVINPGDLYYRTTVIEIDDATGERAFIVRKSLPTRYEIAGQK